MQSTWNSSLQQQSNQQKQLQSQKPLPHASLAQFTPATLSHLGVVSGGVMPKSKQRSEDLVRPESDDEEINPLSSKEKMKSGPSQLLGSQLKLLKNRESILDEEDNDDEDSGGLHSNTKIDDKNDDMMIDIDEGIGEQRAGRLSETYQYNMKHSLQVQQKLSGNYPKVFSLRASHHVPQTFQKGIQKLHVAMQKKNAPTQIKFAASPASRLRITKNDQEWVATNSLLPKRQTVGGLTYYDSVNSYSRPGHSTDNKSMLRLNINSVNMVRSNVRQSLKGMQTVQSQGLSVSYVNQNNENEDALESCRSATNFGPSGHMKQGYSSVHYSNKLSARFGPTTNKSSKQASKNYLSRFDKVNDSRVNMSSQEQAPKSEVRPFYESKQGAQFAILSPKVGPLSQKSSHEVSPQHGSPEILLKKLAAENSSANVNSVTSDNKSDQVGSEFTRSKIKEQAQHRTSPQLCRVEPKRRPATPPSRHQNAARVESPPAPILLSQMQADPVKAPAIETHVATSLSSQQKQHTTPLKDDEILSTIKQEYERDLGDTQISKFIMKKQLTEGEPARALKRAASRKVVSKVKTKMSVNDSNSNSAKKRPGEPMHAKKGEVSYELVKVQPDLESDGKTMSNYASKKSLQKQRSNRKSNTNLRGELNADLMKNVYQSQRSLGISKSKLSINDAKSRKTIQDAQKASDKNMLNYFALTKNEQSASRVPPSVVEHASSQASFQKSQKKMYKNLAINRFQVSSQLTSAHPASKLVKQQDVKLSGARKISEAKVIMPAKFQSRVQEEPMSLRKNTDSTIKSEAKSHGLIQKKKSNMSQRVSRDYSTNKTAALNYRQNADLQTVTEMARSPSVNTYKTARNGIVTRKGSEDRLKSRLNSSGGNRSRAKHRRDNLNEGKQLMQRRSAHRLHNVEPPGETSNAKAESKKRDRNRSSSHLKSNVASPQQVFNARSTDGSQTRLQSVQSVKAYDSSRKLLDLKKMYLAHSKNRYDRRDSSESSLKAHDGHGTHGIRKPSTQVASPTVITANFEKIARRKGAGVEHEEATTTRNKNNARQLNMGHQENYRSINNSLNERQQSLIYIKLDINNMMTMHNHNYQHNHQHFYQGAATKQPLKTNKSRHVTNEEEKTDRERSSPPQPIPKDELIIQAQTTDENYESARVPNHGPTSKHLLNPDEDPKIKLRNAGSLSQSNSRQRQIGQSKDVLAQITSLTSALQIDTHQPFEQQTRRMLNGINSTTSAQLDSARGVRSLVKTNRAASLRDQDKYLTVRDSTGTNDILKRDNENLRQPKSKVAYHMIQSQIAEVLTQTGDLLKNKRALGRRKTTKTIDEPVVEIQYEDMRINLIQEHFGQSQDQNVNETQARTCRNRNQISVGNVPMRGKQTGTKTALERSAERQKGQQHNAHKVHRAASQLNFNSAAVSNAQNHFKFGQKIAARNNEYSQIAVQQNGSEAPNVMNISLRKSQDQGMTELLGMHRTNSMQAAISRLANAEFLNNFQTKRAHPSREEAAGGRNDGMNGRYSSLQHRPDEIIQKKGGVAFNINSVIDDESDRGYQLSQRETQNSRREKTDRLSSTRRRFQDQLKPRTHNRHSDLRNYASQD